MSVIEYTPIRVSTLRGDLKIPFDVYVRVAGKYIHYCRAGESFEGKRLERLKAKKLKKMFIRPEDEIPYAQYMEQSIDQAYDAKSGKPLEIRAEVIQGFQQAASEQFMEDPSHEFSYNHVRSSVQRFVEFLSKQPDGAQALLRLHNNDSSITHHSVNVATLATMMVMNSAQRDNTQTNMLTLGCMLHDIEHISSNFDITKPIDALDTNEKLVYFDHPLLGAKRLPPFVDQTVMNVVLQHEEYVNGTGFPKGLRETEIDPLVLYASVANAYDRLISFQKMQPKDAVKTLLIDKMGLFPLAHLQLLQATLKNLKLL